MFENEFGFIVSRIVIFVEKLILVENGEWNFVVVVFV